MLSLISVVSMFVILGVCPVSLFNVLNLPFSRLGLLPFQAIRNPESPLF